MIDYEYIHVGKDILNGMFSCKHGNERNHQYKNPDKMNISLPKKSPPFLNKQKQSIKNNLT